MSTKTILLVEDNQPDEQLILHALRRINLANQVDVMRDGQQALDYLESAECAETLAPLGVDWLATNEPPHA